ncbi:MAG TPA: hypothetical protein PLH01_07070, partial [Kiritimatiellia bacterium]|nr:hypothetical protein [Kiritimatiellia bacterium]
MKPDTKEQLNLKRAVEPSTLFGFMVSWFRGFWFHGFMVSRFQGFIQIGIGIGIAIGIDRFTTEHFPGFQGFGVSGF